MNRYILYVVVAWVAFMTYGVVTDDDDAVAIVEVGIPFALVIVLLVGAWESAEKWLHGGGVYRVARWAGEVWRRAEARMARVGDR